MKTFVSTIGTRPQMFYLVVSFISLLSVISCDANAIDRGAWLHDEEGKVWYQEVQLAAEPQEGGDASRAKGKYRATLRDIPGLTSMGITRYPFPDGNWVIKVTFSSQSKLDDAMSRDIIPPFLDGVPVIVDDTPATFKLLDDSL